MAGPCVLMEADWGSRTGHVAVEGYGLEGLVSIWQQVGSRRWISIVWLLAVEPVLMTLLAKGVLVVLTEVVAADERGQTRSWCWSWCWMMRKRRWRRQMVEYVGYVKMMRQSLKSHSH